MQIVTNVRTLKEIFASGEPRIHEYEALIAKARRHQKAKALLQIVDIYACTPEEAAVAYEAIKKFALGSPCQFVEVRLVDVPSSERPSEANPFDCEERFIARKGSTICPLTRLWDGTLLLGSQHANARDIDQVWKVVPKT